MREASCRCYAIVAREAPVAIIFRRGPSAVVQLVKWNLEDDTFEEGQWFKGRIYERRADLSPSGKYLIYFAAKYRGPMYSWTAVSKPPYLTAVALWEGMGAWGGGGLFDDDKNVQLNHSITRMKLSDTCELPASVNVTPCGADSGSGEDSPVMDMRLERDGWVQTEFGEPTYKFDVYNSFDRLQDAQETYGFLEGAQIWYENLKEDERNRVEELKLETPPKYEMFMTLDPPDVHEKQHGDYTLQMTTFGFHETNGPPWVQEFRVIAKDGKETYNVGKADWADWDKNGDLLFSKDGCIYRSKKEKLASPKELINMTASKFKPITAPPEFRVW